MEEMKDGQKAVRNLLPSYFIKGEPVPDKMGIGYGK